MVPHSTAVKQITRLGSYGKPFQAMSDDGIAELVNAVKLACSDPRHAERVFDSWIRLYRWMPNVSDIYRQAEETQNLPDEQDSRYQCKMCGGTGWQTVYALSTMREGSKHHSTSRITRDVFLQLQCQVDWISQRVDSGVTACECDYGMRLANARHTEEMKRMADEPERPQKRRNALGRIAG